ncbi:MAG: protoglobin domain-containing protein [Alphaproteobacteria bacterium]
MEAGSRNAEAMASIPTLDAKTRAVLADFLPVLEAHLDDIVAEFLDYATAWREMPAIDRSPQSTQRFREAQGRHLLKLFSGEFDEGYFARISRMGEAHERVGLEPRWYLGAYGHVLKRLVDLAIAYCGDDAPRLLATVSAINRVVELDMSFAVAALDATPRPAAQSVPTLGEGIPGLVEAGAIKSKHPR